MEQSPRRSPVDAVIWFCLNNKLVVVLLTAFFIVWGIVVAPFDWDITAIPRDPVPVDAIPDIGENQQIVFAEWMGRSPQDVENQITYPLTVSLLGLPGVKTVRSYSFFGFSTIYIIFDDSVEYYWSRTRVLEKLNSLPPGMLPAGVQPMLGPDSTGLGQVYWYTLEGRDPEGNPTGGWGLNELRTVQDWYVRYALQSVEGVAEVSSIGGFTQEYHVDVDPDAMRAFGVTLEEVLEAVRMSNVDTGARTIEANKVEYIVRGLGLIHDVADIENTVIKTVDNVPVMVKNVAAVALGPALRRGVLDKAGVEAVGGAVVARYGENPLEVINKVKDKIAEIGPGLPRKTLEDGTVSQIMIVPFYDRSDLIYETLGTLNTALTDEILVTIIVVLLMVFHLRSSLLISGLLPLAVLMAFIAMKIFGVDANIVALSGIAIAIGTMVDMGIVICENILRHLRISAPEEDRRLVVYRASSEVGRAVLTAVMTTVVSFLPVFAMEGAEGKLFKPLAFTKTFALLASIVVALVIIPPIAHLVFGASRKGRIRDAAVGAALAAAGIAIGFALSWIPGGILLLFGIFRAVEAYLSDRLRGFAGIAAGVLTATAVALVLAGHWLPLGPEQGLRNHVFVIALIATLMGAVYLFYRAYIPVLHVILRHKWAAFPLPLALLAMGAAVWLGFGRLFDRFATDGVRNSAPWQWAATAFPGLSKEFMPALDEGSFMYMPSAMPHASIGAALDMLQYQDRAIASIPEVETVVGKIGRVDSPMDPAPISMVETVVIYKNEFMTDSAGHLLRFKYDKAAGDFVRDDHGELIPDPRGRPFRQWRDHIQSPNDIWDEIVARAQLPGVTGVPKLQPIEVRLLMLQTGMRAAIGVKVFGPDLASIERAGFAIEALLKQVPEVNPDSVVADRIVGKPYLEIVIDREAIARYGLSIEKVQEIIEVAIGGRAVTTTIEGRERYAVRVRYLRELRGEIETIERILVSTMDGTQIPLSQLATIEYRRGPQDIKSEDTFLVGYVTFDKRAGFSEVDTVEASMKFLQEKIDSGELVLPEGVTYRFTGSYENQVRSERKLRAILPLALFTIFMILYLNFRAISTTVIVFSGIGVAWAGGFVLIWLYAQPWFLDFRAFGVDMRELFQVRPFNLSVAVWVGFLALFGIASDDGVIIAEYMRQRFDGLVPKSARDIRDAALEAARRRIRPCLMTLSTTVLALVPVLTSTGRGSDIMVPMALPSVGGMVAVLLNLFLVPCLYCMVQEWKWRGKYVQ